MDDMNYNDPVKRPGDKTPVIVIVAFVLMLSLPYLYSRLDDYLSSVETTGIPVKPELREIENRQSVHEVPDARRVESSAKHTPESGEVIVHDLSISKDSFVPVSMIGAATSLPLNIQFHEEVFNNVKHPRYTGYRQWYAIMELGNRLDNQFHMVLDLQKDNAFLLYFDKNNNNDLTDDGKPLRNTGSGPGGPDGFACNIAIPWQVLIQGVPFNDDFDIWFFLNEAGWDYGNQASHYSRTQLQTSLRIQNKVYMVLLIDQGYNDADLSNDGITVDINGNNKIDRDERSALTHVIDGRRYEFRVHW